MSYSDELMVGTTTGSLWKTKKKLYAPVIEEHC